MIKFGFRLYSCVERDIVSWHAKCHIKAKVLLLKFHFEKAVNRPTSLIRMVLAIWM